MMIRACLTLVACALVSACKLAPKAQCNQSEDCVAGERCVAGACVAEAASDTLAADAGIAYCDEHSGTSPCPSAPGAPPMTCVQASALGGGRDFCAEACDPSMPTADPADLVCFDSGALLHSCHPNGKGPAADCPAGLNCYRTSFLSNSGVCLPMPVCSNDSDCPANDVYNVCSASIVRNLAPAAVLLPLDHLNCVHAYCASQQSSCPSSEGCLGTQYSSLADFCAPNCDSALGCPPNYSCARATSGPGSPALCIPGIPGARCNGDHCLLGACEESGAGFSICATPCTTAADCTPLNTSSDDFVCVDAGTHGHCVTPRPFDGANCANNDQCNPGEFCSFVGYMGMQATNGECRIPCKSDGTCDPRGGLPHTCLRPDGGGCYPGNLGLPCTLQSECMAPLVCSDVPPESPAGSGRICTFPCDVDGGAPGDGGADLAGDPICDPVPLKAYCASGFCRARRAPNQPCTRDAQCSSHHCDVAGQVCMPPPPNVGGQL